MFPLAVYMLSQMQYHIYLFIFFLSIFLGICNFSDMLDFTPKTRSDAGHNTLWDQRCIIDTDIGISLGVIGHLAYNIVVNLTRTFWHTKISPSAHRYIKKSP